MARPLLLPLAGLLLAVSGCASDGPTPSAEPGQPTGTTRAAVPGSTPAPAGAPKPAPGTVPPSWLGTRVLADADGVPGGTGVVQPTPRPLRERRFTLADRLPALPGDGFASQVADPAPAEVLDRSTWVPGCPVARDELAWVQVSFRGFDGARHTGEVLVNSSVVDDVVAVFRDLWRAEVPLESMRITTAAELELPPTGDGNNTGAFVCRPVTGAAAGSQEFSQHAYGLAVDVNPFQNPYEKGDVVIPELASAYRDRGDVRPGMVLADGPVTRAFADVGWAWGGAYRSLKDYQHFSSTGL